MKLLPQVEALEGRYGEQLRFAKVEAPKNRALCVEFKVMALPTLLFFKEGREVDRLAGNVEIVEVEKKISDLV